MYIKEYGNRINVLEYKEAFSYKIKLCKRLQRRARNRKHRELYSAKIYKGNAGKISTILSDSDTGAWCTSLLTIVKETDVV